MDNTVQGLTIFPIGATLELFISGVAAGAAAYLWYRFKKVENKMETSMNREEVKEMINDKVRPLEYLIKDTSNDIKRVDTKLDKILTTLLSESKRKE
jgi:hypothetical protein